MKNKGKTVLNKLASSLNRRDQVANQELAKEIVATADTRAVKEIVENLKNKDKAIQSDCIKVLNEISELNPDLVANYITDFLNLLTHKNNRLQWGAMATLNFISKVKPKEVYQNLAKIMDATDHGSVITRDNAVNILINLAATPEYMKVVFPLLIEQILKSAGNQLPMYAERMLLIINEQNKKGFIEALYSRLDDLEKESKRIRVEKVIKKLIK